VPEPRLHAEDRFEPTTEAARARQFFHRRIIQDLKEKA